MVEKTIQQFKDNLEIEEVGQSIELPKPDNMNNGIEVIPEEDGGVTLILILLSKKQMKQILILIYQSF